MCSIVSSQALKRELRCLEADARNFAAGLDAELEPGQLADMKKQLEGRFRFLWGIYRAHSEVCPPLDIIMQHAGLPGCYCTV